MGRREEGGAGGEKEGEGVLVGGVAVASHAGVEGEAGKGRAMGGVGLDELVVERAWWVRNKVEQGVGVRDVWDLESLTHDQLAVVHAVSEGVGMDLLYTVHSVLRET